MWAGKLDYWLVGPGPEDGNGGKWANLCRFEGEVNLEWEPFALPSATKEHVGRERPGRHHLGRLLCAGTTAGSSGPTARSCTGTARALTNASPASSQGLLQGEYTAAAAREGPAGERSGLRWAQPAKTYADGPLTTLEGEPPRAAVRLQQRGLLATPVHPIHKPRQTSGDPYRTDLVAATSTRRTRAGWRGTPRGCARSRPPRRAPREGDTRRPRLGSPSVSPPRLSRYRPPAQRPPARAHQRIASRTRRSQKPPNNLRKNREPSCGRRSRFSLALGEALAGGKLGPATEQAGNDGEPVIARAGCDGTTSLTRFRRSLEPADRSGGGPADRPGRLHRDGRQRQQRRGASTTAGSAASDQPPHLYRLTNGQPPEAPEGNDEEPARPSCRRRREEERAPVEEAPPPPPPVEAPATVTQTKAVKLPAAVYDVKAKLHTSRRNGKCYLSLYITFKLRRPVNGRGEGAP